MFDKIDYSREFYGLKHTGDTFLCCKSPIYEKSNEIAG